MPDDIANYPPAILVNGMAYTAEQVAALVGERDRLVAAREATLEQEVTAILDAMSVIEIDQSRARIGNTLIPALAKMMALLLFKPDGELYNVMEWSIGSDPGIGELRLMMQRVEGKTLSDLYHEVVAERDAAQAEVARLRGMLDRERAHVPGRYAFYHRHLALAHVRKANPDLHNEASCAAMAQIDMDGGVSFQDVVGELEKDRDQWRGDCKTAWRAVEKMVHQHARTDALIADLATGAAQRSQSHADVLVKIEEYRERTR